MPMTVTVTPAPKEVALSQHASWVLSWEGSSAVIAVEGALDVASAGAFASTLAALGADGCDVVVDMARVGVIETTALSVLVCVHRLFEILGLTLTVRAPSRRVQRLLKVCQLQDLIRIGGR